VSREAVGNWLERRRRSARTAVKLDPKLFAGYVGSYQLSEQRSFVITREGDRLFIDVPRNSKSEMFAEAEGRFFLKFGDIRIRFIKDKGEISGIEIDANGETLRAKKVK